MSESENIDVRYPRLSVRNKLGLIPGRDAENSGFLLTLAFWPFEKRKSIQSDRTQISNLNGQIDTLKQKVSNLESQPVCTPDSGYSGCASEISSLQSQVRGLQSQASSLQAQVDSLTKIVNLQASVVLSDKVTVNWGSGTNYVLTNFKCDNCFRYAGFLHI